MLYFEYAFIKELFREYKSSELKRFTDFDDVLESSIDNCILFDDAERIATYGEDNYDDTYSVITPNGEKKFFSVNQFWDDWDEFANDEFKQGVIL